MSIDDQSKIKNSLPTVPYLTNAIIPWLGLAETFQTFDDQEIHETDINYEIQRIKVLWEGSLNILSQHDSCEVMRRIHSERLANEMIKFIGINRFIN